MRDAILQNRMHKETVINIVSVVALLVVVGLGFFLYKKAEVPVVSETPPATEQESGEITIPSPSITVDKNTKPESLPAEEKQMNKVTIDTNFGEIILELYDKDAPLASENFRKLAEKGFYNNLIFHRVIFGFMIQGGDPQGTGMGGPGYQFADELDPNTPSAKAGYKKGVLAMANSGPNTNGSQFFIMLADYPLPHNYTIFGRVISGQDVVDKIGKVKTGTNDRPVTPVTMKTVTLSK